MKQFIVGFLMLCSTFVIGQNFPQGINYQAVARDANGNARVNQQIPVQFTIYQSSVAGTVVWQERQLKTTNSMGQFNAVIGAGSPVSPFNNNSFKQIAWGVDSTFLKVEINANISFTGLFSQIGATTKFQAVPYAMNAAKSDTASIAKFSQWSDYAIYQEVYPSGTNNPSVVGWNQRNFNTTQSSSGTSIIRTGSTITLMPGSYYIKAEAPSYKMEENKVCLRDASNNVVLIGTSTYTSGASNGSMFASVTGVVTVNVQTSYKLDHYSFVALAQGLGDASSIPMINEVFATILIQKIK